MSLAPKQLELTKLVGAAGTRGRQSTRKQLLWGMQKARLPGCCRAMLSRWTQQRPKVGLAASSSGNAAADAVLHAVVSMCLSPMQRITGSCTASRPRSMTWPVSALDARPRPSAVQPLPTAGSLLAERCRCRTACLCGSYMPQAASTSTALPASATLAILSATPCAPGPT